MYTHKHLMPEKQAGREITMRVKKIIAAGIVTMTMFAMTACQGSASNQTADSTNVASTVQTATKTQLQTQAATQAVTVASEAATEVPAQSVTEEAASAVTAIDYSGDTILSIKHIITNHFVDWDGDDYDRDENLKKIIATYSYKKYSAVEFAFKLDTDDHTFCIYAREY